MHLFQATNSVATLLATWALRVAPVRLETLGNVSIIVVGVIIASIGEIKFSLIGFICTCSQLRRSLGHISLLTPLRD